MLYKATEDSNLSELYKTCLKIEVDQVKTPNCVILIETKEKEVFGCYLDLLPGMRTDGRKYSGSSDSFVFTLLPELKHYPGIFNGDKVCRFYQTYFEVGFED